MNPHAPQLRRHTGQAPKAGKTEPPIQTTWGCRAAFRSRDRDYGAGSNEENCRGERIYSEGHKREGTCEIRDGRQGAWDRQT